MLEPGGFEAPLVYGAEIGSLRIAHSLLCYLAVVECMSANEDELHNVTRSWSMCFYSLSSLYANG